MSDNFKPFAISVSDDEIADLKERLEKTRWPDHLPDVGWDYGIDANLVRELAEYWKDEFDWRSFETYLNSFENLTTDIDGQRIHTIHTKLSTKIRYAHTNIQIPLCNKKCSNIYSKSLCFHLPYRLLYKFCLKAK